MAYTALDIVNECLQRIPKPSVATLVGATNEARWMLRTLSLCAGRLTAFRNWDWSKTTSEIQVNAPITGILNIDGTDRTRFVITSDDPLHGGTGSDSSAGALASVTDGAGHSTILGITQINSNGLSGHFGCVLPWGTGAVTGLTFNVAQNQYGLPSDFRAPVALQTYDGPNPIPESPVSSLRRVSTNNYNALVTGPIESFTVWAGWIFLWPFPASITTYRLHYFKAQPEITTDAAVPLAPETFRPILTGMMLSRWYRDMDPDAIKKGIFDQQWMADLRERAALVERGGSALAFTPGGLG